MSYTIKALVFTMYFIIGITHSNAVGDSAVSTKLEEVELAIKYNNQVVKKEFENKLRGCEDVMEKVERYLQGLGERHSPKGLAGLLCNYGAKEDLVEAQRDPTAFFGRVSKKLGSHTSECLVKFVEVGRGKTFECEEVVQKYAEVVQKYAEDEHRDLKMTRGLGLKNSMMPLMMMMMGGDSSGDSSMMMMMGSVEYSTYNEMV